MANAQSQFQIDVNINGVNTSPTQPRTKKAKRATTITGMIKQATGKNGAIYAASAAAIMSVGKTYIDARFSVSENANKANRFNTGLKFAGYAMTIYGGASIAGPPGAAAATIMVAAQVTNDVIKYNNFLEKRNIRYNYTNQKYKQTVANGTRWRGGSL